LNEYIPCQVIEAEPVPLAVAFPGLNVVEPDVVALEFHVGGGRVECFAVSLPLRDGYSARTNWTLVLASDREVARHPAAEVVIVDVEGMLQIGNRTAIDVDVGVDLLAAIAPRVAERELPVDVDLRAVGRRDHHVRHVGIGVLDDRIAGDRAPGHVKRRMSSPLNFPTMRGRRNSLNIVPSNVP
jgi:hypothetical protein